MKRNKFLEVIGFRFIANHNSKEIHKVKCLTKKCQIEKMTDAGYCTKIWSWVLRTDPKVLERYEGCYYCYPEKHWK